MGMFPVVSEPPRVIRVLIAEDNRIIATQFARLLETAPTVQFAFDFVESLASAISAARRKAFHVALLDLGLPDSDGLQTFVRLHEQAPQLPIVVCTGVDDEELAIEALRRGAQDYLVKGVLDRMALIKSVVFAVERKHAADKLRESEEMHRSLLEAIPDIVCKVDVDGCIVFSNQAVTSLGYRPEELVGRPLSSIVHPQDYLEIESRSFGYIERVSAAGPSSRPRGGVTEAAGGPFDVRYRTRGGDDLPVNFSPAVLRNRRGEVAGIVAIARDMREMHRLIRDLELSREQLRERTAQLIHTEKMTALGQLAAGVAHEMNQPLNAMKLACGDVLRDLGMERLAEEDLQRTLGEVVVEIDKIAELIQHMGDFSRKTSGRRQVVEAVETVDDVIRLVGEQIRSAGIRLVVDVTPGLRVSGAAARLAQALMNVVTNAREALSSVPDGSARTIEIRVRNWQGEGEPGLVAYEVTDTGPGVPEGLRERVFEPFFTTKHQGEGTGLGLSIVTQVVEEHQGRVELECASGQGTTVRLLIPSA